MKILAALLHPLLPAAAALLLAPGAAAQGAYLVNIATRAPVGGAAGTPIPGFVLAGAGSKPVLVRAAGPGLGAFGVAGTLADPRVELFGGSTRLAENDNWITADAAVMARVGAFAFPGGSRDAALVASLRSGDHSAPVLAADSGSGVALVEVYDTAPGTGPAIVNASTRAFVGTGDNVLIPGFVVGGTGTMRLLIRAVGPALAGFGVAGALADRRRQRQLGRHGGAARRLRAGRGLRAGAGVARRRAARDAAARRLHRAGLRHRRHRHRAGRGLRSAVTKNRRHGRRAVSPVVGRSGRSDRIYFFPTARR